MQKEVLSNTLMGVVISRWEFLDIVRTGNVEKFQEMLPGPVEGGAFAVDVALRELLLMASMLPSSSIPDEIIEAVIEILSRSVELYGLIRTLLPFMLDSEEEAKQRMNSPRLLDAEFVKRINEDNLSEADFAKIEVMKKEELAELMCQVLCGDEISLKLGTPMMRAVWRLGLVDGRMILTLYGIHLNPLEERLPLLRAFAALALSKGLDF